MDENEPQGGMAQDTDVALPPDIAGMLPSRVRLPTRRAGILRPNEVATDGIGVASAQRPDAPGGSRRVGHTSRDGEDARRAGAHGTRRQGESTHGRMKLSYFCFHENDHRNHDSPHE